MVIDILTIIIALYAAALSSILAWREIQQDKQKINVVLFFEEMSGKYTLVIENAGIKPVTLIDIACGILHEKNKPWSEESVPHNAILNGQDEYRKFPIILKSIGDSVSLKLGDCFDQYPNISGGDHEIILLTLFDSLGKQYPITKHLCHNIKWGVVHGEKPDRE
jgi:hypothetical protein